MIENEHSSRVQLYVEWQSTGPDMEDEGESAFIETV